MSATWKWALPLSISAAKATIGPTPSAAPASSKGSTSAMTSCGVPKHSPAASLLHDVGHGPFSHVFEPCLDIDHELWSCRIIQEDSEVNKVLRGVDPDLPKIVAALIDVDNHDYPWWEKNLLSSQLDVDRLD